LSPAIDVAAEVAKKDGKDPSSLKIAMAFENDPFSLDVRAGVVDTAKKYGMKIIIDDKLPRDLSDMSATLTKVRALKPDVLVVSGHSKGAATAARQIAELKIDVPLIAMTHCEAAKVIQKFGASSNGFLCPTQWGETLSYKDDLFGSAMDYDQLFKKSFKGYTNVPYQSAQASAAVMVWKDAFERAQSFDIEKVRDALASTDMATFYGGIKFSEAGNNIAKPMVLRQIQDGKLKIVAPTKWASDPLQHPRKPGM
jgi:branched-chain amino acid transport system substrate-binding protein